LDELRRLDHELLDARSIHFFIRGCGEYEIPLELHSFLFEQQHHHEALDDHALHVDRAPAPNHALGQIPGKGRVLPLQVQLGYIRGCRANGSAFRCP
jgi:hypothetical protein